MAFDPHAGVNRLLTASDRADVFDVHDTFETDAHHAVGRSGLGGRKGVSGMDVVQTQKDGGQRLSIASGHETTVDGDFHGLAGGKENFTRHAAIPIMNLLPRKAS